LGKFILKKLLEKGVRERDVYIPRIRDYDLREKKTCLELTKSKDVVIHLAARAGGIKFNKDNPALIFYDNAIMALHLIDASYKNSVKKFVGIGSACEYPKFTRTPFQEKTLWDGYPEESNAPYGLAKKFMLVQSQAYHQQYGFTAIHILMTNLYGPGDNFDLNTSHVIPALIKKIIEAKKKNRPYIEVWGTGKPTREFLYVEDAAEGIILAAEKYNKPDPVNLGSEMEISIRNLVKTICEIMDYRGAVRWNHSKPDGQPRRKLDVSRAKKEFGFSAKTNFQEGLGKTISWYKKSKASLS